MTTTTSLQRVGAQLDAAGTRAHGAFQRAAQTLWSILGSTQLRNAMSGVAVICLIAIAEHVTEMASALEKVGAAQQITGYAVMRQLQAMGMDPSHPLPAPARAPSVPHAIDPAAFGPGQAAAAAAGASTTTAAAAAPAPGGP